MSAPKVFRDEVKESRESYYIIYQPADANLHFADLTLVFPENDYDPTIVANAMEKEFESWLKRYPVPLMVSACDSTESVIHNPNKCGESHIMGYLDLHSGKTIWQWGLLKNEELPKEQMDSEYLARIYDGIPFRLQADVRKVAEIENRNMVKVGRVLRFLIIFVFIVPLLIEVISLGVAWVGYILSGISIMVGIYKVAKAFGWPKPSETDKAEEEKKRKMRHYYWHCERNTKAFNHLMIENFEREAIERTHKEAKELGMKVGIRVKPCE